MSGRGLAGRKTLLNVTVVYPHPDSALGQTNICVSSGSGSYSGCFHVHTALLGSYSVCNMTGRVTSNLGSSH